MIIIFNNVNTIAPTEDNLRQLRQPTNQFTGVAETLMITLYSRVVETQVQETQALTEPHRHKHDDNTYVLLIANN